MPHWQIPQFTLNIDGGRFPRSAAVNLDAR